VASLTLTVIVIRMIDRFC